MKVEKCFKLDESGKQWLIAAIITIAVVAGLAVGQQTVNADENTSTVAANATVATNTKTTDSDTTQQQPDAVESKTVEQQAATTPKQDDSSNQNGWNKGGDGQMTYYQNGQKLSGRQYIELPTIPETNTNGATNWYLMDNGTAQSGVQKWAGTYYYFDPNTYLRVDNNYVQSQWGLWYMFGPDGRIATRVYKWAGTYYYFDPNTYLRVDNDYRQAQWGNWYMFGPDGRIVTGLKNWYGSTYYFDPVTYLKIQNQYMAFNGISYYFDSTGIMRNDSFATRWQSIINNCRGHHVMIAIQSQKTGAIHEYTNAPGYRLPTASSVKVAVLAQLLHNTNGNLTDYQRDLASRMIRNSDNDAATAIINNYLGGTGRMQEIYNALGMNETTPNVDNWAKTLTTATDQLKLLNEIFIKPHSNYLNDQSRNYIKSLMSSVNGSQTWGISAGSSQYYLKNGWSAFSAPWAWYVSSIGFIPQDDNGYSIAVYTDNNIPMSVGVNIIEQLALATKQMY